MQKEPESEMVAAAEQSKANDIATLECQTSTRGNIDPQRLSGALANPTARATRK
jgi:hypothetical protein